MPDHFGLQSGENLVLVIEIGVEYAASYGALFEINASAFRKGWKTAYPGADIFDVLEVRASRPKA
jgi:histidinol-phosphatase (PHP family)